LSQKSNRLKQFFRNAHELFGLGQHYTAVGIGYEFSPLLNSQCLALFNWTDYSRLVSINTVYSLSDESELTITISLPGGDKPDGLSLRAEFGTFPHSLALTFRYFF
jgi:hypothetical protein